MSEDSPGDPLPDPCDPGFYVRYVEIGRGAGVEPVAPHGVRVLIDRWNTMLRGEAATDGD